MSSASVSRPFGVIFTVRRAVFICGETEAIVPWTTVPEEDCQGSVCAELEEEGQTVLELDRDRLVLAFHEKPTTRS